MQNGRACGCGATHRECPIWSQVLSRDLRFESRSAAEMAELQRKVVPTTHVWWRTGTLLRSKTEADLPPSVSTYLRLMCALYFAYAQASGVSSLVDSSKSPSEAALLSFATDVSASCVEIVRDPRAVVLSALKRKARGTESASHPLLAFRVSLAWLARHSAAGWVRRRYGCHRSIRVRYEDFIAHPDTVLESIAIVTALASPDWGDLATQRTIAVPPAHTPAGNGTFPAEQLVLESGESWHSRLHWSTSLITTLVTFPLLRARGYATEFRGAFQPPRRTDP